MPPTSIMLFLGAWMLVTDAGSGMPTIEETAEGFRVSAEDYAVELTNHGGLRMIQAGSGMPIIERADFPPAWVLRSGANWMDFSQLRGTSASGPPTVTKDGDALLVSFSGSGSLQQLELTSTVAYRFALRGEFETSSTITLVSGPPVELISFPAPLSFDPSIFLSVVFPFQRGVVLAPEFFSGKHQISTDFPPAFMDFIHMETTGGSMAVSALMPKVMPIDHAKSVFFRPNEDRVRYHIDREMHLLVGKTWTSEPVLFQFGRNSVSSIRRHWSLGASGAFPALRDKMDAPLFERLSQSILLKNPDGAGPRRFADFAATLNTLPANTLLHLTSFMPGGHDSNYPDYLPPESTLGTLEEFRALIASAQALGMLVMPYTNPSWWDAASPTMQTLGDAAISIDEDGNPRTENYEHRTGHVITPWHPGVQERLRANAEEFLQAPAVDFLFEDQVGARSYLYDANPNSPTPYAYNAGLLYNAKTMSTSHRLMTEGAWDRLAEFEVAFCGNGALDWEKPSALPEGTWLPYPLSVIAANEHVVTWPHNLAGQRMAHNRADLLYAVAFGNQLAYDLNRGKGPWLPAMAELQRRVLSRGFAQRVVEFEDKRLSTGLTRLEYTNGVEIIGNWSNAMLEFDGHPIATNGFLWRQRGSELFAAWLTDGPVARLVIREGDAEVTLLTE